MGEKKTLSKLNGNVVCVLVAAVIVTAITGITVCVKHVINADLFE